MKKLARSVAGSNTRTIASRALAIPHLRVSIVSNVGCLVRQELKSLCADKFASVHRDTSILLDNFSLDPVFSELSENAPVLTSVLMESCPSTKNDDQKKLAVVVSSAVLLKFRNPKMKLIASIFSLILQAGHAGRQVKHRRTKINAIVHACMHVHYIYFTVHNRFTVVCRKPCSHYPHVLHYTFLMLLVMGMMHQFLNGKTVSCHILKL